MKSSQRDPNWINVHIDAVMIWMGLRRQPKLEIEENQFKKTAEEREELKKAKAKCGTLAKQVKLVTPEPSYVQLINKKKLIVNLHNLEKKANFKTTHCFMVVNETEVRDILNSGSFFPKREVKSVYFDNKPFKFE